MRKSRFTQEQIIAILAEQEASASYGPCGDRYRTPIEARENMKAALAA